MKAFLNTDPIALVCWGVSIAYLADLVGTLVFRVCVWYFRIPVVRFVSWGIISQKEGDELEQEIDEVDQMWKDNEKKKNKTD